MTKSVGAGLVSMLVIAFPQVLCRFKEDTDMTRGSALVGLPYHAVAIPVKLCRRAKEAVGNYIGAKIRAART